MSYARSFQQPLRILFVMPPCLPTPPIGYGGIEAVAAPLLQALEKAGCRITLTTPIGSTIEVTEKHELTEPIYPILSHPYNEVVPSIEAYVAKVMNLAWEGRFDVIHDFSGMLSILNTLAAPLRSGNYPPVIHTIHGPIEPYTESYNQLLRNKQLAYTGISRSQVGTATKAMQARTKVVYNGVDANDYQYNPDGGQRLLVLGRICEDKGQDRLVRYCAAENIGLDIAGTVAEMSTVEEIEAEVAKGDHSKVAHKADLQIYKSFRRLIDGTTIKFHGNVSGQHKHDLLGGSSALVVPNRWAEPFGMVAIEAMASGTPVVAMNTGAMPELIKHGVTGYLADTFAELCEYLKPEAIAKLDRAAAREHVIRTFGMEAIAQNYIRLYREVTGLLPAQNLLTRRLAPAALMYEQIPAKPKHK